jgi:hypothetical protein
LKIFVGTKIFYPAKGFSKIQEAAMIRFISLILLLVCLFSGCSRRVQISGDMKTWHPITLTFTGPQSAEDAIPNPFLDYRLQAVFTNGSRSFAVPGYFAADGKAAETGARSGNQWRVHFMPDAPGEWICRVSFRKGEKIALSDDPAAGVPISFDGTSEKFVVMNGNSSSPIDRGKLEYVGGHYLKFQNGGYYLKGGADSPENFLAYYEFDDAERITKVAESSVREGEAHKVLKEGTHRYEPHAADWRPGDPTWQGGKGKNIIGALNYLAEKGMNSVYFLTMNVEGDGKDVWPWTAYDERYRFDCSKLDQWEVVFSHMSCLGLLMHVILTETENEALFEVDEKVSTMEGFADSRKLYYRELVARFAHHPALVWNIGEENGWNDGNPYGVANSDTQRRMFSDYLRRLDPYHHPIIVHTLPGDYEKIYQPLLGHPAIEGASLQMGNPQDTHAETLKWLNRSADSGRPWFVCLDEIGPADTGVKPDADDYWHDDVRHDALWGNLMAGGSGCEWYFGYKYAHNDLNCEDWRSRDHLWDLTRYALEFFQKHLPFWEMQSRDELTSAADDYCFAHPGVVYAVYLPHSGSTNLLVEAGQYSVRWYDPRHGGELQQGSVTEVQGAGSRSIGTPPQENDQDWVALVRKM